MTLANKQAMKRIGFACILVSLFIISEIIGGYVSGSLAIMTDAAHMISDLASLCVSLLAIWIGSRQPKKSFNFGYARAEVLGALITIVLIWYISGVLIYLAIHRIRTKEFQVESDIMIIVAGLAVVFNILLGLVLHGVCQIPHSHSHNHSHRLTNSTDQENQENDKNHHHINVRAALIHVLGDLIQSIGVLVSSIVIKINPEYKLADPICTLIFAVIVFATTITILKDTFKILMEGLPVGISFENVKNDLLQIEGVMDLHDLKIWSLTIDKTFAMVHLMINKPSSSLIIINKTVNVLKTKHETYKVTVQVEEYNPFMENCKACDQL